VVKIIEAIYRLSPDKPKMVTYEDIVVKAWQLYPDDFGLRGYSDRYPDASDIHKPLYNVLKSKGWVKSGPEGAKKFSLTQFGWEQANSMFGIGGEQPGAVTAGRTDRQAKQEIEHLTRTMAAELFFKDQLDDILDTDFYAFYRTSVRAKPQEFEGRLATVKSALDIGSRTRFPYAVELQNVDEFLREKFAGIIKVKSERKSRD
jgi:hypothetical protein